MPSIEHGRAAHPAHVQPAASLPQPRPPIIVISGPTGVGKSALALELAEVFEGEIISADSRQVYRGLEIGTAQPTAEEQRRVPHHLIGFLAPHEPFSVAEFVELADNSLEDIARRGGVAFVVGGTHHYVQALVDRLAVPRVGPDWTLRAELEAIATERGAGELHARLARRDPDAAREIPPANVRRVIRALEVAELTGSLFSELGRRRGDPLPALHLALTMDRAALYARVDRRAEDLLRRGWLDEVRALLQAGYPTTLPAITSTGYRELVAYLEGRVTLDEAVQRVKYSTHAYVRRQYAWLRRDSRIEWLDQEPGLIARAQARLRDYLGRG